MVKHWKLIFCRNRGLFQSALFPSSLLFPGDVRQRVAVQLPCQNNFNPRPLRAPRRTASSVSDPHSVWTFSDDFLLVYPTSTMRSLEHHPFVCKWPSPFCKQPVLAKVSPSCNFPTSTWSNGSQSGTHLLKRRATSSNCSPTHTSNSKSGECSAILHYSS